MEKKVIVATIFIVFSNLFSAISQEIKTTSDYLITKSYDYLRNECVKNSKDIKKFDIYSDAYLEKAKKENNIDKTISGLLIRAKFLHVIRDFSSSIDCLVKSYDLSKNIKSESFLNRISHNIGIIRVRSGEYRKALKAYNRSYIYYTKYPDSMLLEKENYYITLFSIANTYRRLNIKDSARYYLKEGLDFTNKENNKGIHYQNFILTEVILDFDYQAIYGSETEKKIDNLIAYYEKDKKRTHPNLFFAYYYSGKNYLKSQDTTNAIKRFKQIDSLFV